jgi:hypothetical protein
MADVRIDNRAMAQLADALRGALAAEAESWRPELDAAVPLDKGDLRADLAILSEADGDTARVALSYGNMPATAGYAVEEHEDTRLRHRGGRRAKWLQEVAFGHAGDLARRLKGRL